MTPAPCPATLRTTADAWTHPVPEGLDAVQDDARAILQAIQDEGDAAIARFSEQFDGFAPHRVVLQPFADYDLEPALADAIQTAADRVRRFATFQRGLLHDAAFEDATGTYGQRIVPVAGMGAYVPGGRAPLVSTALMTLIPAHVAGVETRVAVTPSKDPAVEAACSLAGATHLVRMGGAQAIGALAYGSKWTPAVDMIVGPGNAWVNAAKGLVQDRVGIDTLAGPSEVLVIAGPEAKPAWLAWDLIAQAEHDPFALSVLASWDDALLDRVEAALKAEPAASEPLERGQFQLVACQSVDEAVAFSNRMAPEHLHVHSRLVPPDALTAYGSLFLGETSAVALGDYCSGPNHTLPTSGFARVTGGLSVSDFLRVLTWQEITPAGLDTLGPVATALADAEGLQGHARSVRVRMGEA